MEPKVVQVSFDTINDDDLIARILELIDYMKKEDRSIRWTVDDLRYIELKGLGQTAIFRPVIKLIGDNTIEISNSIPKRGESNVSMLPKYTVPCWGFCGPNQKVDIIANKLANIDIDECDFTPFSADVAVLSESKFQDGRQSWEFTASNKQVYIINKVKNRHDLDVFAQINKTDRSRRRQVIRVNAEDAKRMIVQSEIYSKVPEEVRPLLKPLFDANNFLINQNNLEECNKLKFPSGIYDDLYDKEVFKSDRYIKIYEQINALNMRFGKFTIDDAIRLMKMATPSGDLFSTTVRIIKS